uniref:Putative exonuclease n=1 Tax=viral metagenome TaxID=1070528 RepID=A0A6M3JYG3_9ZZZZ
MKLFFCDIETSGLDEREHGILQISGEIIIPNKDDISIMLKPRLFPSDVFDPDASAVNGISATEAYSEARPTPNDTLTTFTKILDKYVNRYNRQDKLIFVAYNATFDDRFLRKFFEKCNNRYYGSYFHWPPIDVAVLAMEHLKNVRETLPNFKLHTVAKHFNIAVEEGKLHDASYDIWLTKTIYSYITKEEVK